MTNLNKVMLIGRLGRDPETRYTKTGSAVANFSIATDDSWKDKSGNKQERTEWHNIVAWARTAEFVQNYLRKGRLVYIEGKLQTRDWTDNQNVKHYRTEVVANNIQFLDRQSDAPGGGAQAQGGQYQGGDQQGSSQYGNAPQGGQQGGGQQGGYQSGPPQGNPQQGGGPGGVSDPGPGEQPYVEDDIPF